MSRTAPALLSPEGNPNWDKPEVQVLVLKLEAMLADWRAGHRPDLAAPEPYLPPARPASPA